MLNQVLKAMSHQGNKLILLMLTVCFFIASCNKKVKYNEKELADIRERTLAISQSILGKETSFAIFQMANDSISNWTKYELGLWKYLGKVLYYQLDSVFCVNKEANKIVFSILKCDKRDDAIMDVISHFYGVKIRNTWYFFDGPDLVLPREYYQKDIHMPLSFEKLKQIATSNIYRYYLKKNKNGEWEINDEFFDRISNKNISTSGYGGCIECQTEEEYYMYLVKKNWQKKK